MVAFSVLLKCSLETGETALTRVLACTSFFAFYKENMYMQHIYEREKRKALLNCVTLPLC